MTEGYIELPITVDPDVLAADAFAALAAGLPGYVAHPGNLDVWLVEVLARMNAESAFVASRMPLAAFRELGGIAGVPVKDGAAATALTTWTLLDTAGYTIPAGTVVAYRVAGDQLVPFTVQTATTVPPGSSSVTGVVIEAVEVGEAGNGLAVQPLVLVDSLAFVVSVASTTISSAGVDPETDSAYLDRLSEEFTLLTPRPILPEDFAVLARRVDGVHRAVAIDGGVERTVTVAVVDLAGNSVPAGVKTDVETYLDGLREVNFVVEVIDPTFTAVAVAFAGKTSPGADPALVTEAAQEAVKDYLSPARWAGGDLTPPVWRNEAVVRYLEVSHVLTSVAGLDYLTSLTVNGGTADITLAGPAALPASTTAATPTTVTGSVTVP